MILEQIPFQISARASHESELAYQVDHSLTRLKELVFLVHLERIKHVLCFNIIEHKHLKNLKSSSALEALYFCLSSEDIVALT